MHQGNVLLEGSWYFCYGNQRMLTDEFSPIMPTISLSSASIPSPPWDTGAPIPVAMSWMRSTKSEYYLLSSLYINMNTSQLELVAWRKSNVCWHSAEAEGRGKAISGIWLTRQAIRRVTSGRRRMTWEYT
jgi:hypothetical protein